MKGERTARKTNSEYFMTVWSVMFLRGRRGSGLVAGRRRSVVSAGNMGFPFEMGKTQLSCWHNWMHAERRPREDVWLCSARWRGLEKERLMPEARCHVYRISVQTVYRLMCRCLWFTFAISTYVSKPRGAIFTIERHPSQFALIMYFYATMFERTIRPTPWYDYLSCKWNGYVSIKIFKNRQNTFIKPLTFQACIDPTIWKVHLPYYKSFLNKAS